MDDNPLQQHRTGGKVEPLDRSAVLKAQFRIPDPPPRQRFEVRDPFAEVTYRSQSFEDMVPKAEQPRRDPLRRDRRRRQADHRVPSKGASGRGPEPILIPKRKHSKCRAREADGLRRAGRAADQRSARRADQGATRNAPARVAALEAALNERYVIKRAPLRIGDVTIGQTEYRHRGDTSRLAFTESTFRAEHRQQQPLGGALDGRRRRSAAMAGAARLR